MPWSQYASAGEESIHYRRAGRVTQVVGLVIEGDGPAVSIGEMCHVETEDGNVIKAEVVGFREEAVLLMPLAQVKGVRPGSRIISQGRSEMVSVGEELLGRVIGAMGEPLDHKPTPGTTEKTPLMAEPVNPMERSRIDHPLDMGVRAINATLAVGRGQRLGIFSGSGVGKSTLMGMMARYTDAEVNVIGLVGERGREVVEFIERELGPEGMSRSIVVVATSDQPPLMRIRAAYVATAIAEWFRARDKHVVLMMDSLTRFAMAQREVGLAAGEPPTTKGYPPSAFMLLPRLLERAGTSAGRGSITAFYTVLMEGDDLQDPIVDAARGILDGHIVLSRDLASRNHYPAIDILGSISRLMSDVTSPEHQQMAAELRDLLATYARAEDMVNIGAYQAGSNAKIDRALKLMDGINGFLRQPVSEGCDMGTTVQQLGGILT